MQFPKNVSRRASGVILNSSRGVRSYKCVNFFGTLLRQGSREGVSVAERSVQDLRHVPRYHEPLQYDQDEESSSISESRECAEALSPTKRVSFDEDVVVVPIPMRSDHTEILRSKLWSNAVEMCDNVERNLFEFEAENREWRNVCLEDEMYSCSITQELIHPVHVEYGEYCLAKSQSSEDYLHEQQR